MTTKVSIDSYTIQYLSARSVLYTTSNLKSVGVRLTGPPLFSEIPFLVFHIKNFHR